MHPMITGPTGGAALEGDPAPFRLEIHDLVKNKYQYSLFIQALQRMLDGHSADPLSFVGIGSIHGLPAEAWAGATPPTPPWYCAHGTEIFPTWHRPYVSLIEQEIYRHAQDLVSDYNSVPDAGEWRAAARNLRFPYWDWARYIQPGQPAVPTALTIKVIKIWVPTKDGSQTTHHAVSNPLFCGSLREVHPRDTFPCPFHDWITSIRYPTTKDENAESNVSAFNETFRKYNPHIRMQTYLCLTVVETWQLFSNHGEKGDVLAKAISLEGIHDLMHNTIGGIVPNIGDGHMAEVAVAAFDPIFFLHHANVDRLLALWQAINPDTWVPGKSSAECDVSANTDQTALLPFWQEESTFWNSEGVRLYAHKLNYSYPEFKGLRTAGDVTARKKIIAQVKELYGSKQEEEEEKSNLAAVTKRVQNGGSIQSDTLWSLLISFDRDELGTSYLVEVYIKDTFAGVIGAFANKASGDCANCQNTRRTRSNGIVHLNPALLTVLPIQHLPSRPGHPAHDGPGHLPKREVLRTLHQHLSLRVVANKPDGTPIDISRDLPTLKAVPFSHSIDLKGPSDLPVTGKVTYHDLQVGHPWKAPANFWAQRGIQVSAVE